MKWRTANKRRKEKVSKELFFSRYHIGAIYEACSLHPCYITEVDFYDISGKSILDGSEPHNCSMTSCGVFLMNKKQIKRAIEAWESKGERGLTINYYGSEELADEFMKEFR
jgi:hypothetical protein